MPRAAPLGSVLSVSSCSSYPPSPKSLDLVAFPRGFFFGMD